MFSTGEYDYIKGLTENYYNNGYKNYLCITNNPIDYGSNNNLYDIYCYYSKNNLEINNNILKTNEETIKCSFDSNNYNTNNSIDKLVCENFNGNVELNQKEYIYSSIEEYSNIIAYKYDTYNYKLIGTAILGVIIIYLLYRFIEDFL